MDLPVLELLVEPAPPEDAIKGPAAATDTAAAELGEAAVAAAEDARSPCSIRHNLNTSLNS